MDSLSDYLGVSRALLDRMILSVILFTGLLLLRQMLLLLMKRRIADASRLYYWRRAVIYTHTFLVVALVGRLWVSGIDSIATFLGLASAGLAIAMHDTIASLAGWVFIVWRRPFVVGDRIQIGETSGDVIDVRPFQFSMVEIGNWVDSDQSTGRIIHVPNSKVLREPLANYQAGFDYIWHEIPVLITFESNWKEAKKILTVIAGQIALPLAKDAKDQIRSAGRKYLIFYSKLTPIVYTTVRESGVKLTMRYMVKPRHRRGSDQEIWEAILDAFGSRDDIDLAYPTTRFFTGEKT